MSTRIDEKKYIDFSQKLAAGIKEAAGANVKVLCNEVPKEWAMEDAYCQLIPCNDPNRTNYGMIPRLWAFEVSYKGIVVYSKLMKGKWPSVSTVSNKIANMLQDSSNGMNRAELSEKYRAQGLA